MSEQDWAAGKAAELLPCADVTIICEGKSGHNGLCPAYSRESVAAALCAVRAQALEAMRDEAAYLARRAKENNGRAAKTKDDREQTWFSAKAITYGAVRGRVLKAIRKLEMEVGE